MSPSVESGTLDKFPAYILPFITVLSSCVSMLNNSANKFVVVSKRT